MHLDETVGVGRARGTEDDEEDVARRSRRSWAAGRTATSPRATADGTGTPRAGSRGRPSSARGCRARRSPPPSSNALTLSRSRWSPCSTLQWTTLAGPDGSDSIGAMVRPGSEGRDPVSGREAGRGGRALRDRDPRQHHRTERVVELGRLRHSGRRDHVHRLRDGARRERCSAGRRSPSRRRRTGTAAAWAGSRAPGRC